MLSILLQFGEGFGDIGTYLPIILIIIVFYFFMIRPQTKKAKETKKFREAIAKGDRVVTIGGIHGKIAEIKEQTVMLTVATGVDIKVQRSAISPEYSTGSGSSELEQNTQQGK